MKKPPSPKSLPMNGYAFIVALWWRQRWKEWGRGSFRWTPFLPLHPCAKGIDAMFLTAILQQDMKAARRLVELGANAFTDENLALDMAAAVGNVQAVSYLLALGADIHARNESPLAWAVGLGHEKLEALLLERGADATRSSVKRASIYRQADVKTDHSLLARA